MKKTILALACAVASFSSFSNPSTDPLTDKVNRYNELKKNASKRAVQDTGLFLRNEAGTVAQGQSQSCATCVSQGTTPNFIGQNAPTQSNSHLNNQIKGSASDSNSAVTYTPKGLGDAPPAVVRGPDGKGMAWESPSATTQDISTWRAYENTYKAVLEKYNSDVAQIQNKYMDPANGKLVKARLQILDNVEKDVSNWVLANPKATASERANFEAERLIAGKAKLEPLLSEYNKELKGLRDEMDSLLISYKFQIENPYQDQGGL